MSANPEETPPKPFKLTSLKTAKPAPAPVTGETPEAKPVAPKISFDPASANTAVASVPVKDDSPEKPATPAASKPAPLTMLNLRVGGGVKIPDIGVPAPPPIPATPPAITPLSPAFQSPKESPAPEELRKLSKEIRLTKSPGTFSGKALNEDAIQAKKSAPAAEPVSPVIPEAEMAPVPKLFVTKTPAKAPVVVAAKPSRHPLAIAGGAVALLAVAVGAALYLTTHDTPKPVPAAIPVAPVEEAQDADDNAPPPPPVPVKPVAVVAPKAPVKPVAPSSVTPDSYAPRTRRPELETWLDNAGVTAVSEHRITMNGRVATLGGPVNAEGTLKWIGRDSKTQELLFIDDAGVIYTRPVVVSR